VRLVILVAVAALVAYAGINQVWHRSSTRGNSSAGQGNRGDRVGGQPGAPSTSPVKPARVVQIVPIVETAPAGTALAAPPAVGAVIVPEAVVGILPQIVAQPADAVMAAAEASSAVHGPSGDVTADPGPHPHYAKLIAEADRLLGTGGTERARLLYEQALGLRPAGAAALAGLGYTALDVGHKKEALLYFKRAIAGSASFAPAVFGLGEVYREQGKDQLALENYRRYVELAPSGVDVLAARRQIEILEARLASRAAAPAPRPSP
jgi:hypothetical protein